MSDTSFQILLPFLQDTQPHTLWIADENVLLAGKAVSPHDNLKVITNRYDVYQDCLRRSFDIRFNDYDLSHIEDSSVDQIVYRISKEKLVVHHLINEAFRTLKPGGKLIISGEKNEGVKSYISKAGKLLGENVSAKKNGNGYIGILSKQSSFCPDHLLDDKHYPRIREIGTINEHAIQSKPGLFGWEKIDQGSQLLMDTADQYFASRSYPASVLDLGCGYGYLTLRTLNWPGVDRRQATDNNAAAVACSTANFNHFKLAVTVSADDCGSSITSQFDCVLCNPPFHQGFSVDSGLTTKFLKNSAARLAPSGIALFVVNQFIGIEKRALEFFKKVEPLASDKQFKVLALYK
ncbi:methyltransferase [Aestuariicella sp. G3-2]|uniref:methyltransferase n=1 Tax=Pseudomaricurvus albidus TaxID=2842452 RepID=UPI001C0C010E|nr:methyltransferase [Aestuariicella albida]MBU3070058.1 methyltransferase [Aestuariicella albida]